MNFDASRYKIPHASVASALALARALIAAGFMNASPPVKKAQQRVHDRAVALQLAWIEANKVPPESDVREIDARLEKAWRSLAAQLASYASLPETGEVEAAIAKKAADAAALEALISASGFGWFQLPFAEQWAESDRRIMAIVSGGHEGRLNDICGEVFFAQVKKAHGAYGEALGITQPAAARPLSRVIEPYRALHQSLASYVRVVAGTVDDEDEETANVAVAALRPIEVVRARHKASLANSSAPSEPAEEPIPAPIPAPAA